MNRRVALIISVIGFNLMACCCGGAGGTNATRPGAAPVQAKNADVGEAAFDEEKGQQKPHSFKPFQISKEDNEALKRRPIMVKIDRPSPRVFTPITSSEVGNVKIELVSGNIEYLVFKRRSVSGLIELKSQTKQLALRARITNTGTKAVKFVPWYATQEIDPVNPITMARDQNGNRATAWKAGVASWPVGSPEVPPSLQPDKAVTDLIAFSTPKWEAEEIDIFLAGANVVQPGKVFSFKIGRGFFEDDKIRAAEVEAAYVAAVKAEEDRLNWEEDVRIAGVQQKIKKEEDAYHAENDAKILPDKDYQTARSGDIKRRLDSVREKQFS